MSWKVGRFESQRGQKHFQPQNHPDRLGGPPGLLFTKYWDSFPEQKEAGREFDHSPPPTIEVENEWSCTYTAAVCLHDINRDTFTSSLFIVKIYQISVSCTTPFGVFRLHCSSKFPSIFLYPVGIYFRNTYGVDCLSSVRCIYTNWISGVLFHYQGGVCLILLGYRYIFDPLICSQLSFSVNSSRPFYCSFVGSI